MKFIKFTAVILIFCVLSILYACGENKKISAESRITSEIEDVSYDYGEDFESALKKFSLNSASIIFTDGNNKNKNLCYSPASLYIAFALAATGAENQTRDEMFSALGLSGKDNNYVSKQINSLFGKLYFENYYGALKIANSVWVKKDANIKKDFEENTKNNFYSEVFNADFKDMPETPNMMKKWVEDNTNNLISPEFDYNDPDLIFMYIINTIYFKDSWRDAFMEKSNTFELFHTVDKNDTECEFMNKTITENPYFRGNGFTAASLEFYNGGKMTFVLPDENTDIYDLISSPVKLDYIFNSENEKTGYVYFKIPKFKTQAGFDLIGALKNMGVKQAFNSNDADFSGITTDEIIYISAVNQETYIKIDEIGVEAAAMTRIEMKAAGIIPEPDEKIEMFLNRPFIYFITDKNGVILFEGVIFNPKS